MKLRFIQKLRSSSSGVWSFVDQGLTSAGNLLLSISLARLLQPSEYGVFVLFFGILLALNTVHQSIITYPMSVLAVRGGKWRLRKLTSNSLLLTVGLDLLALPILLLAERVVKHRGLGVLCFVVLLAWQLHETLRRALMSRLNHRRAVLGDATLYLGQVILIWVAARLLGASVAVSLICIALAAVAGTLVHYSGLGLAASTLRHVGVHAGTFFQLGRWALLSNGTNALTVVALPWILARSGFAAAGRFQALINLVVLANPVAFSIGNLLIPLVAREHRNSPEADHGRSYTARYVKLGLLLLLPYFAVVIASPGIIISLVYKSNSSFVQDAAALRVLAISFLAAMVSHVLSCYFLARRDSRFVLKTQLTGSAIVFVLALLGLKHINVLNAAALLALMNVTRLIWLSIRMYRDKIHSQNISLKSETIVTQV